MSLIDKLRNLDEPGDPLITVSYTSEGEDVYLRGWEDIITPAYDKSGIALIFARFVLTPGLRIYQGGSLMTEYLNETGILVTDVSTENHELVSEQVAKILTWDTNAQHDFIEYEKHDWGEKWGEMTFSFQVQIPLSSILEASPDLSTFGSWTAELETESLGHITLS